MKVDWTVAALADVENVVPENFRLPMLEKLEGLRYLGQARSCTDPRYHDALYIKFRYWFVMFVPSAEGEIIVIAVEYNYDQEP